MLELQNIGYAVEEGNTRKEILKNISLKIDDRFVAITGPNGGGKSTLAKIIAGINKPTSGKILLDGEDITDLSNYFVTSDGNDFLTVFSHALEKAKEVNAEIVIKSM